MNKLETSIQSDWYSKAFYRVSAVGVIRNKRGEYLLCNEHDRWTFPGGGWDYGESLHDALRRELFEEVALVSEFDERVVAAIPFYNPGKEAWSMWVACEILYNELDYGVGEHSTETKWVSADEIDDTTEAGKLMQQVLQSSGKG